MNSLLKKSTLAFLVAGSLIVSGCFNLGGGTAQQPTDQTSKVYENSEFSIIVPKDWDVFQKDDFTSQVPPETQVVFRNNVKNETYTADVVIVKNFLQESIPTLEYAKMVFNRQALGLYNFKENKKDLVKIKIGDKEEETNFLGFEAKKGTNEKLVRYLQTYGVKGNNAYIVTGSMSALENENTVKSIEEIVKSFRLK